LVDSNIDLGLCRDKSNSTSSWSPFQSLFSFDLDSDLAYVVYRKIDEAFLPNLSVSTMKVLWRYFCLDDQQRIGWGLIQKKVQVRG